MRSDFSLLQSQSETKMRTKKRTSKRAVKARRQVHWELLVLPWLMSLGGLVGVGIEFYLRVNNFLWPLGVALVGGVIGALCDTALFLYRTGSCRGNHRFRFSFNFLKMMGRKH